MPFGWRVYGLGVMSLGIVSLVFGHFDPGQPVPANFPAHIVAYVVGAFMVIAAAAIEWRKTAAWGAGALAIYYVLFVVILMNGRLLLVHYREYVIYEEIAMQLAVGLAALIIYANAAKIDSARAARLTRVSLLAFGVCCLVFGGAHFAYLKYTASMIPKWLPPSQIFWTYVTGISFIAAGIAILTGIQARLAAILLTVMLISFGVLSNGRILLTNLSLHGNWSESAINLATVGAAWVVADSLARPKR